MMITLLEKYEIQRKCFLPGYIPTNCVTKNRWRWPVRQ